MNIRLKPLCAVLITIIFDAALAQPQPAQIGRLSTDVIPLAYRIDLHVDPTRPTYFGSVDINISLKQPTFDITLHAQDIAIETAQISQGPVTLLAVLPKKTKQAHHETEGLYKLHFSKSIGVGPATLSIKFKANFGTQLAGLYRAQSQGRWYAYTQFEAADARKAFPCFDEPGWKVPFAVSVTVPTGMLAVSNARQVSRMSIGEKTRFEFAQTKPLPTYLLALVVGDIDIVQHPFPDVPLRGLTAKGNAEQVKTSLNTAADMLPLLERYFGLRYPYPKLDMAALVEFGSGAMENAGLITFREESLLIDPQASATAQKRRVAYIIAHELAHQWFGNYVTMSWWDDLWLNEAFATWMGNRIVDTWRPETNAQQRLMLIRNEIFRADAVSDARPIRQPIVTANDAENAFDVLTYLKGATVLTMIEKWVGPQSFQRGVQRYLRRHAWKNATADDLFAALTAESGKDVARVAKSFLYQSGVPFVKADLTCTQTGSAKVHLQQRAFRPLGTREPLVGKKNDADSDRLWAIPMCVWYPVGNQLQSACTVFDQPTAELTLPSIANCPKWIYPNAEETGYFRWGMNATHLHRLQQFGLGQLPAAYRAMLVEQVWGMVSAGEVSAEVLLSLLTQLRDDTSPAVIRMLVDVFDRIDRTWGESVAGVDLRKWMTGSLDTIAKRIGWQSQPGEMDELRVIRPILMTLLSRVGNVQWHRQQAVKLAHAHINGTRSGNGSDHLEAAMGVAASHGAVTAKTLKKLLIDAKSPAERLIALKAVGQLSPGAELSKGLQLVVRGPIRKQDLFTVLEKVFENSNRQDIAIGFLQQNLKTIKKQLPSFGWSSTSRLPELADYICDPQKLRDFISIFERERIRGAERIMSTSKERAEQCIALAQWGVSSVSNFMQNSQSHTAVSENSEKHNGIR